MKRKYVKRISIKACSTSLVIALLSLSNTAFSLEGNDRLAKIISRFDVDQDGFLSRDEYVKLQKMRFKRLDTNGDEKLNTEEMKNAFSKDRKKQGGWIFPIFPVAAVNLKDSAFITMKERWAFNTIYS